METFEHDTRRGRPERWSVGAGGLSRGCGAHQEGPRDPSREAQQEAVYLRFQGGLSYKEIAEVTGHTVTNVGFLLHAAVKSIRAQLVTDNAAPAARTAEGSR